MVKKEASERGPEEPSALLEGACEYISSPYLFF